MENQNIMNECIAELEVLSKKFPTLQGVKLAFNTASQETIDANFKMEAIFNFISNNIRKETEPTLRKLVDAYDCFHTNLDPNHQFKESL